MADILLGGRTIARNISARDMDEFANWLQRRASRKRGRQLAARTLTRKTIYVAKVACVSAEVFPATSTLSTPDEVFRHLSVVLTDGDRVEVLLDLFSETLTPGALAQVVYALTDFAAWAQSKGWVTGTALNASHVPGRNQPKPIVVYTPDEVEMFCSASRGVSLRWWALLCFLAETGRRAGEALSLRWDWFNSEGYILLPTTKNGDPQYVPLTRKLRDEVFTAQNIEYLRNHEQAKFKRSVNDHPFPWSYSSAYGNFDRFCAKVGLPNRGFHNFRHTRATEWLSEGVPPHVVQAMLGHRSIQTTIERYAHVTAVTYSRELPGY